MDTIHVVFAAAAALLGLSALVVASGDTQRRLVVAIVSSALAIGHVASLLETAPSWYSVGLIATSIAGSAALVWLLVTERRPDHLRLIVRRRAHSPRRGLYGVPAQPGVVDAEIVEDAPGQASTVAAASTSNVVSIVKDRPRRHVTAGQIVAGGPRGAYSTMGATYVAANLDRYVHPEYGPTYAKAHRNAARGHVRPVLPTRTASPERTLRAMQIRTAYGQSAQPRPNTTDREYRA